MKKIFAFVLVIALVFSLSSCGKTKVGKVEFSKKDNSIILKDETYHKELASENGEIISILDYTYPVLGGELNPVIADNLNRYFTQTAEGLLQSKRLNLKYTDDYKERFGIKGPITTLITYEIYYQDDNLLTLVFTTKEGSDPASANPVEEGFSFSLNTGHRFTLNNLYVNGEEKDQPKVMEAIEESADESYSPNGYGVDENIKEMLNVYFSETNFCLTADSISFLYSFPALSNGSREGTYYCDVSLDDLEGVLSDPSEFRF